MLLSLQVPLQTVLASRKLAIHSIFAKVRPQTHQTMAQISQTVQNSSSDREGSALLNLPTGLRLQIWEHVFPGGEYIPIKPSRGTMSILRRFDVCGKQSVTFEMADTDLLVDRKAWGRHGRALLRHGYQLKSLRPVGGIFKHGDPAMLLSLALTCRSVWTFCPMTTCFNG